MNGSAVRIFDVPLPSLKRGEILEMCSGFLEDGQHMIVTVNPEFLLEAKKNAQFREVLQTSDLNVVDGFGIALVAALKFRKRIRRMTGVRLVEELAEIANKERRSIFLLGGFKDTPYKAAQHLRAQFPNLQIAGAENEWDAEGNRRTEEEIIRSIHEARPDVLFVAFGQVRQEFWLRDHLKQFPSVRIAVGVGGTFDFFAKNVRRAPRVFQHFGFEWLWRFLLQPWRFRRMLNAVVRFPLAAFFEKPA